MDLASIIQALSEQIRTLQDRVDFLEEENKALRQEIVGLRKENTKLRQENDRLKERLGLNSSNSSLPPSRAFIESKSITGLVMTGVLGGQPGHPYHGYQSKSPNKVVNIFPEACWCSLTLEIDPDFRAEQKIERGELLTIPESHGERYSVTIC